ncbi:hypothetical protein [Candidatus Poriferisodalis sp.]|uniref:hypothetical protein n=1 Tax=Candidatus Poriferisodalis sp. TaxID=3101277 RepID=UPI003C6FA46E
MIPTFRSALVISVGGTSWTASCPPKPATKWGDIRYCKQHTCTKPTCIAERVIGNVCWEHASQKQRERFISGQLRSSAVDRRGDGPI